MQNKITPARACIGLKRVRVSFVLTVGVGLLNEQVEMLYRGILAAHHMPETVCATVKAETMTD